MHGVVSILDEAHYERVEALWAELKREFGVGSARVVHYPHFSYHVAVGYDLGRLTAALETIAGKTAAFTIKATGLGIFTGSEPVLYVPIVRSAALTTLHKQVWTAIEPASRESIAYYEPDLWLPHITLSQGDIDLANLGAIVQWLNEQSLNWDIPVTNLSVIYDTGQGYEIPIRIALQD